MSAPSTSRRLAAAFLAVLIIRPPAAGPAGAEPDPTDPPNPTVPDYPRRPVVASTAPVVMPGSGAVGDTGGATYTLPLRAPDGVMGMQPALSLSYGGGWGPFGAGWSISGASVIAPCSKTYASEGTADGIDFDRSDVFCLDGQKLVGPTNGSGTEVTLHTEVEGFDKIVAYFATAGAAQPETFTVWQRGGLIATYGPPVTAPRWRGTSASTEAEPVDELVGAGAARVAVAYPIRELVDRNGNRVRYVWHESTDVVDALHEASFRLASIEYSFGPDSAPRRRVDLHYSTTPRPDPIIRHLSGTTLVSRALVERIEMYAPNPTAVERVWWYQLEYRPSPYTWRSLLQRVQLHDQYGSPSFARRFRYSDIAGGMTDTVVSEFDEFNELSYSNDPILWDGFLEGGFNEDNIWMFLHPGWQSANRTDVRLMAFDADGDGLDDLLYRTFPTWYQGNEQVAQTEGVQTADLSADERYGYIKGILAMRRSSEGDPLGERRDVSDYLEPTLIDPGQAAMLWKAHLGKSRIADFDGDGVLDLLLARTKVVVDEAWIVDDYPPTAPSFFDHWHFGYTNVGRLFFDAVNPWDPWKKDQVEDTLVVGPVFQQSTSLATLLEYKLFTPPFQRVFADLDGDGRVEPVDAYGLPGGQVLNLEDNINEPWIDSHSSHAPTSYRSMLADPIEITTFPNQWIPDPDAASWTCSNSHAEVIDYEGDGRADVLASTDNVVDNAGVLGIYGRLTLDDATALGATRGTGAGRETSNLWGGDCGANNPDVVWGDWNGDGLVDVLYPPDSYVGLMPDPVPNDGVWIEYNGDNPTALVRWNLGNGFGPLQEFGVDDAVLGARLAAKQVYEKTTGLPVGWDRGTRVADLNHDGRSDIIAMRPEAPNDVLGEGPMLVIAYLSAGDHFVASQIATWAEARASRAEGYTLFQLGEFTGDGETDLVHVEADRIVVSELAWRERPDMLTHVDDDSAAYPLEVFDYSTAWWGTGPRPAPEECSYPVACPRRGFPVVRQHAVFAGTKPTGGPRYVSELHAYEGPRTDLRGRGFVGFATHRIWHRTIAAETVRRFDNVTRLGGDGLAGGEMYPYARVPYQVTTTTPLERMPTTGEIESGSNIPGLGGPYTMARRVDSITQFELRWSPDQRVLTLLPSVTTVTETETDVLVTGETTAVPAYQLVGSVVNGTRSTAATTAYDDYGNPTTSMTTVAGGVETTVRTQYETAYLADWLLGLPTRVATSSAIPGTNPSPTRVIRTAYDDSGLPVTVARTAQGPTYLTCIAGGGTQEGCETKSIETQLVRDSKGRVTHVIATAVDAPDPRTLHIVYDPEGVYPAITTDSIGYSTVGLRHPALGVPVLTVDAIGVTTESTFDGFGRPVLGQRPGSANVTTTYSSWASGDHRGILASTTASDGSAAWTKSDEFGRTVERGSRGFNATWAYTDTEYDHLGHVVRSGLPSAAVPTPLGTTTSYDRLGRVRSVSDAAGGTTVVEHTMFSTTSWDPEGHETYELRDVDGRRIETGHDVPGVSPTYGKVRFYYGAFDMVTETVDASGNSTKREYDPFGRVVRLDDPDTGESTYEYDGFDLVRRENTALGTSITREYDAAGRLTRTEGPDGATTRVYDVGLGAAGQLVHAESADGVITDVSYDSLGRLHELKQTVDGVARSVIQHYDTYSRPKWLLYPETQGFERFAIGYRWDPNDGQLDEIRDVSGCHIDPVTGTPNPPACLGSMLWRIDARNLRGQLTNATYGNLQSEVRGYDPETGELTSLNAAGKSTTFGYDADGNMTLRKEGARQEDFTYDDVHRLDSWTLQPPRARDGTLPPPTLTVYKYDELGNLWKTIQGLSTTFLATFDAQSKPHAIATSTLSPGGFHYDAKGNQLDGDGRTTTWNQSDLPMKIVTGGVSREFWYDASGGRAKRADSTATITYLGKLFQHRVNGTGTVDSFIVHAEPGAVAQVDYGPSGKTTRYMVGDGAESVIAVMKNSSVIERSYFDPFGGRVDVDGGPTVDADPTTPLGFVGDEEDAPGLINMTGRVYDRSQYRFLSPDPVIVDARFGQAYNPYSYVLNNPLNLVDPTGHQAVSIGIESDEDGTCEIFYDPQDAAGDCTSGPCSSGTTPAPSGGIHSDDGGGWILIDEAARGAAAQMRSATRMDGRTAQQIVDAVQESFKFHTDASGQLRYMPMLATKRSAALLEAYDPIKGYRYVLGASGKGLGPFQLQILDVIPDLEIAPGMLLHGEPTTVIHARDALRIDPMKVWSGLAICDNCSQLANQGIELGTVTRAGNGGRLVRDLTPFPDPSVVASQSTTRKFLRLGSAALEVVGGVFDHYELGQDIAEGNWEKGIGDGAGALAFDVGLFYPPAGAVIGAFAVGYQVTYELAHWNDDASFYETAPGEGPISPEAMGEAYIPGLGDKF